MTDNIDEFSEYEAMSAEADNAQQIAMQPNQRGVPQQQMNEQDVQYADEGVEEELEEMPAPKPVKQRAPHTSNMSARARKVVPIVNPNTGRPVASKSTEEELEEIEQSEAAEEAGSEANQLAAEEKMPKWIAIHQPEKIYVINTQTRETIEGYKSEGEAAGQAKILNELDSMITAGGYQ